jgi:glycosyltransferase involved in cell wall biosynthesis
MARADVVVFPSQAMLESTAEEADDTDAPFFVVRYGAQHDLFHPAAATTPAIGPRVRLLNVSHYADQKNLGTLLRAVRVLDRADRGSYRLRLTAGFGNDALAADPACPVFVAERALFRELEGVGLAHDAPAAHAQLPAIYRDADVFVFPSYTESFGHPLVEAMATGLPIVASDTPIHREMCADAAVYFDTFDASACAAAIRRVVGDGALRARLRAAALQRAPMFCWNRHVDFLMSVFQR